MGEDKVLLKTNGKTWLVNMVSLFEELGLPYFVSCNEIQSRYLSTLVDNKNIVVDYPIYQGPLLGMMSTALISEEDLFMLACDMQQMDIDKMRQLLDAYKKDSSYEVYVYKRNDFFEPLCGIYTKRALNKIKEEVDLFKGNFSFQYLLREKLKTKVLEVRDATFLKNYNSREDLDQIVLN